jgi:hypothetical protein
LHWIAGGWSRPRGIWFIRPGDRRCDLSNGRAGTNAMRKGAKYEAYSNVSRL